MFRVAEKRLKIQTLAVTIGTGAHEMQVSCNIRQQVSDFMDLYLCDSDPLPGGYPKGG